MLSYVLCILQTQYNSKTKYNEAHNFNILNGAHMHKEFSSTPDLKKNVYATTVKAMSSDEGYAVQERSSKDTLVQNNYPGLSDRFNVLELNAKNLDKCPNSSNTTNGDLISDHLTDTRLLLNGADSRVGHQRGYYTLPSRHKKLFEEGGSYRAVTKIRPVIKGNSEERDVESHALNKTSLSPSSAPPPPPPPPEHPPPPPPITQVVKLDSKSEYAKVSTSIGSQDQNEKQQAKSIMTDGTNQKANEESNVSPGGTVRSSFKPSDNAKLYASPQNLQQLAYRSSVTTNRAIFENMSATEGKLHTSPNKKRSPTARANSMPPRPLRPQVLRRSSATEMALPTPITSTSVNPSSGNVETYNINGVNYTTYTTFRSPITPDECDVPGSLSSRTFTGIDPDLTPTAPPELERFALNESHPIIPEPDYDMSDSDYGGSSSNGNNYYCGSDVYNNGYGNSNIRESVGSNGTTLERKKKKTVSFVINEEVAAKLQAGRTTRQDSILKDPTREKEREKERLEKERFERDREELFATSKQKMRIKNTAQQPSPFALGERYAEPIVKIPMAKLKNEENVTMKGLVPNFQHSQQNYHSFGINAGNAEPIKTVVQVAEEDKIRIEVPPEVPVKAALNRSNSAVGNPSNNTAQKHQPLQKSRSFCAEKSLHSASGGNNALSSSSNSGIKQVKANGIPNPNLNPISSKNVIPSNNGISENEILRVRSQLKSSRSFTNEFPRKSSSSSNENIKLQDNMKVKVNNLSNDTDINHEEAENSSSGVSSDQEQNNVNHDGSDHSSSKSSLPSSAKFVTYLPVDGGAASTKLEVGKVVTNSSSNTTGSGRGLLCSNVVSSLQPSQQSIVDNVSESGSDEVSSEKSWVLRAEQDNLGRNIIYMKKMLHPKLQAIFDKPSNNVNGTGPGSSSSSTNSSSPTPQTGILSLSPNTNKESLMSSSSKEQDSLLSSSMSSNNSSSVSSSSHQTSSQKSKTSSTSTYGYASQTLPHRHQYPNYLVQQQYSQPNRHASNNTCSRHANKSINDERSISQSLALINQHVNSLGEVNVLAGINNKELCETGSIEAPGAVLAPPPGFSDSESHAKRSHSAAARNVNSLGKKVTFGNSSETPTNNIMTRSMGPMYDGSTETQNFNSDLMSRSIMGFSTTHGSRQSESTFVGGKGMQNESKSNTTATSVSYATLPKKQHLNTANPKLQPQFTYAAQTSHQHQKEFRAKPLIGWSTTDVCNWLDSLFMPEYKPAFLQNEIDGFKLASITKSELELLGVIRVGHMLNIEKSLKRYLTA